MTSPKSPGDTHEQLVQKDFQRVVDFCPGFFQQIMLPVIRNSFNILNEKKPFAFEGGCYLRFLYEISVMCYIEISTQLVLSSDTFPKASMEQMMRDMHGDFGEELEHIISQMLALSDEFIAEQALNHKGPVN